MKKVVVIALLMIFIIYPVEVFANITCNDGTISPSCSDCHQGCCSHHGGVSGGCSSSGKQICNDGTLSLTCTCTPSVSYKWLYR